jgi:hypothetical protein
MFSYVLFNRLYNLSFRNFIVVDLSCMLHLNLPSAKFLNFHVLFFFPELLRHILKLDFPNALYNFLFFKPNCIWFECGSVFPGHFYNPVFSKSVSSFQLVCICYIDSHNFAFKSNIKLYNQRRFYSYI